MLSRYYDSALSSDLFNSFKFFDDLYGPSRTDRSWSTTHSTYRTEATDDGLSLSIDLPGVKSNDLSVQVTGREVKVTGKIRGEDFRHSYRLSKDYDSENIDATLESGVLTLNFKKSKSASRTVDIKVR